MEGGQSEGRNCRLVSVELWKAGSQRQKLQAGICGRRAVRGRNCRLVSVEDGQSEAETAGWYLWKTGSQRQKLQAGIC